MGSWSHTHQIIRVISYLFCVYIRVISKYINYTDHFATRVTSESYDHQNWRGGSATTTTATSNRCIRTFFGTNKFGTETKRSVAHLTNHWRARQNFIYEKKKWWKTNQNSTHIPKCMINSDQSVCRRWRRYGWCAVAVAVVVRLAAFVCARYITIVSWHINKCIICVRAFGQFKMAIINLIEFSFKE